jgi:hypothetical protein
VSETQPLNKRQHLAAIFQAFLVTFLWSTSWVLVKYGLEDIPALTFGEVARAFGNSGQYGARSGAAARVGVTVEP